MTNQDTGSLAPPPLVEKLYTFEVDDKEYRVSTPTITAAEIMQLAGIPLADGLLVIEDDGTQRQTPPGEVFELEPGRRFKKRPRFKRG